MKKVMFVFLLLFLFTPGIVAADVLVITNKDVPEKDLSKDDIKNIFLGKKVQWKDNSKIHFVISKDPDLHKSFLKAYVKRSTKQFKAYWRKMVFTGEGRKPKSFESTEELLKYVSSTPGAVGYIDKNTTAVNVNTLTVK